MRPDLAALARRPVVGLTAVVGRGLGCPDGSWDGVAEARYFGSIAGYVTVKLSCAPCARTSNSQDGTSAVTAAIVQLISTSPKATPPKICVIEKIGMPALYRVHEPPDPAKVDLVYHGLDLSRFPPAPERRRRHERL